MSLRNHAIAVALFVVAGLSGALSGCSNERRTEPVAPETVSNVSVIVAEKTTIPDWLEAVGTVQAAQTSQISSQTMGNIVEIRAREGDRVQSGQVLATIDDAQPRSAVDQATAALTVGGKRSVRRRFRLGPRRINAEALSATLREEIGQSAGVRRDQSPLPVCGGAA